VTDTSSLSQYPTNETTSDRAARLLAGNSKRSLTRLGKIGPFALWPIQKEDPKRGARPPQWLQSVSQIFDFKWYEKCHGLLNKGKQRTLEHYLTHHAEAGVEPNPFFDSRYYRKTYVTPGDTRSSLEHYCEIGQKAGHQPHPAWLEDVYLATNWDVDSAVRADAYSSGYAHFCEFGSKELLAGRTRLLPLKSASKVTFFDEAAYLNERPSVRNQVDNGIVDSGLEHWFRKGFYEFETVLPSDLSQVSLKCIESKPGVPRNGARDIVIYAHYDPDAIVGEHVYLHLKSLIANDCDIVFVSPGYRAEDEQKLLNLCRAVIKKSDTGRDFGSWYLALTHLGMDYFDEYEFLIFANDSVYWPSTDANSLFNAMRTMRFDFWGAVDTHEHVYHVQSWFLAFNGKARQLVTAFLSKFKNNPELPKQVQIREYECWLTQEAIRQQLSVGAYCSIDDIRERLTKRPTHTMADQLIKVHSTNPSHSAWDLMIRDYDLPALKVELLRDNPRGIDNISSWKDIVAPALVSPIVAHLQRAKRTHVNRLTQTARPPRASDQLRILSTHEGVGFKEEKHLVLLAHYDPQNILDPHVIRIIEGLHAVSADIVLISGSLDQQSLRLAQGLVSEVILKTDTGRDFGSWYLALKEH
jgi:hypothetical protein